MNERNTSPMALLRAWWQRTALFGTALVLHAAVTAQVSVTATAGTVGPTSYTTISAAFTAINAGTHQGTITVTLTGDPTEPGSPTALLKSGSPSNYSAITIKPSGNRTVTGTGANNNAVIVFNGADNVTIDGDDPGTSGTRNLTITNPINTGNNRGVIRFASVSTTDGASSNTVRNCTIIGNWNAASTNNSYGIYSGNTAGSNMNLTAGSDNNDNLTFENNDIQRCTIGIFCLGTTTNYMDGLIIRNNTIGNATASLAIGFRGIFIGNTQNVATAGATYAVIEGNDIRLTSSTSITDDIAGIEIGTGNAGVQVRKNMIHDVFNGDTGGYGAYGIWVNSATNNAGISIFNNVVRDMRDVTWGNTTSTSDLPVGILVGANATSLSILHNTVRVNAANSGSTANISAAIMFVTSTTSTTLRNNIIENTQAGISGDKKYAIYVPSGFTFGTFNNNDLYVNPSGTPVGIIGYNGTDQATLAAWRTATSQDAASMSVAPGYSGTDLHITAGVSTQLESSGASVGISTDIDNQVRPGPAGSVNGGATAPDIGADEFDGIPLDLTPPTISYTALASACTLGGRSLTATITDGSGVPTSGAGLPRLAYKVNAGTYTYITGSSIGSGQYTFSGIATTAVAGDVVSYFIVAQDGVGTPNVTASPATGAGSYSANPPTAGTVPTSPSTYTVLPTLGGTYNVGAGQTYTTLTAAVAAYNSACLSGAVTFQLMDAIYSGETLPITINANANASATNTLTIKPASGVSPTISGSSSSAVIVLNGADYVIIEGSNNPQANAVCPLVTSTRDLTITNTNTSTTSAVVWLQTASGSDAATNNTVRNCTINGNGGTQTLFGIGCGSSSISTTSLGAGNNGNRYENNSISKCQHGIYTAGASAGSKNTGTVISQNVMTTASPNNIAVSGIYAGFENNITISGNSISGPLQTGSPDVCGINAGFAISSFTTTTTTGQEVTNATITNNVIGAVVNSGTYSAVGIGFGPSSSGTTLIANNMIYGVASNGTSGDFSGGIVLAGGSGGTTNVLHNTVSMQGTIPSGTAASQTSACLAVTNATMGTLNVQNNIFTNTQLGNTSATVKLTCIALTASSFSGFTSTNNDLYAAGAGPGTYTVGVSGGIVGTNQVTLANWQGATAQDANSKNVAAVYTSTTDLHLLTSNGSNITNLMAGGTSTSVTTDIDCASRNGSTPTIGADEFTVPVCTGAPSAGTSSGATSACAGEQKAYTNNATNLNSGVTYAWYVSSVSATGPWAAATGTGTTTQSYTTAALNTAGTFYVVMSAKCTNTGDSALSNVITLVVHALPTPTITPASPVNFCVSGVLTSSAATGNVWTPGGATTQNLTVSTSGTYSVTVTDGFGCVGTSANTVVTISPQPSAVTVTPSSSTICAGGSVALTASGGTYTLTPTLTFGTQAAQNTAVVASTDYPAPFSVYYGGQKMQMLIRASELQAAGFAAGAQFTSLNFPVVSLGGSWGSSITQCNSFQVKFGYTTATTLSAFTTLSTVVRAAGAFTPTVGYNNVLTFGTLPAAWNGTDNVIIETNFSNNISGATGDAVFQYNSPTSFASCAVYRVDSDTPANVRNATTPTYTYSARPDFKLNGTMSGQGAFTWSPTTGLSPTSGANVTATPSGTVSYMATATVGACTSANTAAITVNPLPTAATSGGGTVCSNGTLPNVTFTFTGTTPYNFTYNDGTAHNVTGYNSNTYTINNAPAGTYSVTALSDANCTATSLGGTATVTVVTAPNAGGNNTLTVCSDNTTSDMSALLGTHDNGGTWAPAGPNYDATTMSPGAFTYTVTGTAPCANAQATITVSEVTTPNAGSSNTLAVCSDNTTSDMAALLGTHDNGGTWAPAGPNYDATTMSPGAYTYTVTGTAPCANAQATITVSESTAPNAGSDGSITVCSSDAAFSLAAQLGGTPDGGGSWTYTSNPHSGTYTPGTDLAGIYTYTVSGTPPCADATATVTVTENTATAWYLDSDGDTYGAGTATMACTSPGGNYVTNNTDDCPTTPGRQGDACNDLNPFTTGDVIDGTCTCVGTPVPSHNWTLRIVTDANGSETSWEVREQVSNYLLAQGSGLPSNSTINQVVSIPDAGAWILRVFDSGNNGIGGGGGYLLRDQNGNRVIDNLGNGAGFTSVSESPEGFYSPVGTDRLRDIDCDNVERWPYEMIVASTNPLVSAQWQVGNQTDDGYEFWFTDPNGSYSRHIFRNHATSGGYGPADATRACKLGLASWTVNPLPANTLLNVRIRGRVNGTNLAWGPACRLKVDATAANCHTTQLENLAGSNFSCGVVGLKTNGSSRIWAKPVTRYVQATNTYIPANKYKFHFLNIGENTSFDIVINSYPMLIYPQYGFQLGASYTVTVQASFDNGATYCPVGASCQISFAATNNRMEEVQVSEQASDLQLWPNPNRGDELHLRMDQLQATDGQVTVEIVNMFGERVVSQAITLNNGSLNTLMQLDRQLASGLYLVNLSTGDRTITKRLVIQR